MNKRIVVCIGLIFTGVPACGVAMAQTSGFKLAEMWSSPSSATANDFSSAILAINPSGDMEFVSDQMPDVVLFGGQYTLGEAPYRISSTLVTETMFERTFRVVYDTSDGSPLIGVNAYPGQGGGPTSQLCFEAGNSLSGNLSLVLWDVPFSVVDTQATTYDADGATLVSIPGVPFVILAPDYSASLNVCYYNLAGNPIGPQRPAKAELVFTISNDVIFRNGFQ